MHFCFFPHWSVWFGCRPQKCSRGELQALFFHLFCNAQAAGELEPLQPRQAEAGGGLHPRQVRTNMTGSDSQQFQVVASKKKWLNSVLTEH